MSFLKSEPFTYNGSTIQLFELSGLQRIEHLQYLAKEDKSLPKDESDEDYLTSRVSSNLRVGARLIAMSLWQGDTSKDIDSLHHEVLSGWPPGMIGAGELFVKTLSDMIPVPESANEVKNADAVAKDEPICAEKPSPVS
ncbi:MULTISPECIES: phage tail assembly chaperone G [Enterobacteriaceae]|uniref:phage tail assembly chaperone G n=1 Tax=Enterobacteriaceae TaxID=543 RepID=UPI0007512278|nr:MULTISPECIES: phage minor tail protein G [Enterobacteriaceae]EEU9439432.1 phage minor tail protein G [Escherichia coli]EFH6528892.1 phage minor tail protein G [Escherichia coli]EHL2733507.1 phage minor tail protein G [Escherichia coli]EHM8435379.1 phage minor tail protein G [Escherichia coli]EHM8894355.1 phage minor tail protein G [Escherichia coli]